MGTRQSLINLSRRNSIIIIDGPRSSEQKELACSVFEGKPFISLKDSGYRQLLKTSPSAFFMAFPDGAIIDEVQILPEAVDSVLYEIKKTGYKPGRFILIYRGIFKDRRKIESVLTILPSCPDELSNPYQMILSMKYPDIASILNDCNDRINKCNREKFEKFLRLCAGMNGQGLSVGFLAQNSSVSPPAAAKWLEILLDLGLITFVHPLSSSMGYSTVKKPIMYFYNTSLLCSLLGIDKITQLILSPHFEEITKAFVVSSLCRIRHSNLANPNMFYYQERNGLKVDLVTKWKKTWAFNISSSTDPDKEKLDNCLKYKKRIGPSETGCGILYLGDLTLNNGKLDWISYQDWEKLASGLNYYS